MGVDGTSTTHMGVDGTSTHSFYYYLKRYNESTLKLGDSEKTIVRKLKCVPCEALNKYNQIKGCK